MNHIFKKIAIVSASVVLVMTVLNLFRGEAAAGSVRTYYIGVEKVFWDYAPSGMNQIKNISLDADEDAAVFTKPGKDRVGRKYLKLQYVEYTNSTFSKRKRDVDPVYRKRWEHLGIVGPLLHAEVGDTIRVTFKNLTPVKDNMNVSIHVHGVRYKKSSEGAPYNDGTSGKDKADDAVGPGQTHTYEWVADEASAPAPMDGSSVLWMYHSHTEEILDTYSGLIGGLVVTAKGQAKSDGTPKEVNREFVNLYQVFDENKSLLSEQNFSKLENYEAVKDSEEFAESNLMHGINGYVYGNVPGMVTRVGEKVRWYVLGMGTEVDLHTPHWHGETVTHMEMKMDMLELLPGSMKIADMKPRNPGTWLLHCHVNDHIVAGMSARITVLP
jgi:manganese oxidase